MNRYTIPKLSKRQLWFCLPLLVSYAADAIATLFGQSPNYWNGVYQEVNEVNLISNFLLSIHPLLFIFYSIVLFGVITFLIALLPLKLSKILALFLFLVHTVAAYTWLRTVFHVDYLIRQALLVIPAVLLAFAFTQVEGSISQLSRRIEKDIALSKD